MQWTWRPYERRHANSVGAAFHVTLVPALARAGVDGAAVWHAKGNAYGLIDGDGRVRATGQLFLWANRYAHGETAPLTTDAPGLAAAAVRLPGGGRTLLLANQTDGPVRLDADAAALLGGADSPRLLSITRRRRGDRRGDAGRGGGAGLLRPARHRRRRRRGGRRDPAAGTARGLPVLRRGRGGGDEARGAG